jgi:hypothetical protein
MVFWFVPQNQKLRFVGCAIKPMGRCDGMRHTSRSSGLLRVKVSLTRVSQSGLKTDECATVDDVHDIITEVTSESS